MKTNQKYEKYYKGHQFLRENNKNRESNGKEI